MRSSDLLKSVKQKLIVASEVGDIDEVLRLGSLAKELELLNTQETEIEERIQQIKTAVKGENIVQTYQSINVTQDKFKAEISPQKRGDNARFEFLEKVKGKGFELKPHGKKKFKTPKGQSVGIPYAREKSGTWFLGLDDDSFDAVVLLCETISGSTIDFVLPSLLVHKIWKLLTRSKGQVKFHVQKSGPNFMLRLPGGGFEPITQFRSATSTLN